MKKKNKTKLENSDVFLFVAKIDKFCGTQKLPKFTQDELKNITNKKVIKQKCATYGVLHFALKTLGIEDDFSRLVKENGKPLSPDYCFSNSHSHNLVAIAISQYDVGVDIEMVDKKRKVQKLAQYVCTPNELSQSIENIEELTKIWTQKEASFKLHGEGRFSPTKLDHDSAFCQSFELEHENEKYYVTICTNKQQNVSFHNLLNIID